MSDHLFPKEPEPELSARQKLTRFAFESPTAIGLSKAFTLIQPAAPALILMYHSVPRGENARWINPSIAHSPELFEQHLKFLSKFRNVISLSELVERLRNKEPYAPGTVVLTLDDGFKDNAEVVAPLLRKYEMPATIFLATSFLDRQCNSWCDDLYGMFGSRTNHRLILDEVEEGAEMDLSDKVSAYHAFREISAVCIDASLQKRNRIMASVREQLAPSVEIPCLMMSWDDVRRVSNEYPEIEFGAHTANHLNLVTNPDCIEDEVKESLERIELELGLKPRFFACPYNRHNAETQKVLSGLPLEGVVAEQSTDPVVRCDTSPYALPRLGGPYRVSLLRDWSSGAYPDLAKTLYKRFSTELY